MKLKRTQKNNEISQKPFKFITLDKIEMYTQKNTLRKCIVLKNHPHIQNSLRSTERPSFSNKNKYSRLKQEEHNSASISENIKNQINCKLNLLLNEKEVYNSKNLGGITSNSSFSITEPTIKPKDEKSDYYIDVKKRILDVYQNKLIKEDTENLDEFESGIIERYKKYSPNDYFNKVSNKVFTNLINTKSKNTARINLKNLILYKPHPISFDKYKPMEFDRINLGRNYHNEKRNKIIEKYSELTDSKMKNNTNFYEKLPFIEDQVKNTLNRLNVTKENYSRLKNIYFGYN